MLSHEEATRVLRRAAESASEVLSVFWLPVSGSRDDLERTIKSDLGALGVVPAVVRKAMFDNANEVLNDLVRLLSENQKAIEKTFDCQGSRPPRCVLALLSRSELRTPQLGSPVTLPSWFPFRGGQTVDVTIRDLAWKATGGLDSNYLSLNDLCEDFFELERAICSRLKACNARDHNSSNRILEVFKGVDKSFVSIEHVIAAAEVAQSEITNPAQFRPALALQRYLVARITAATLNTSTDKSASLSKALIDGLDLGSVSVVPYESYLAVLARPQPFRKDPPERFARNLAICISASMQLITARAHASDYSEYPIQTLRGLSHDLRSAIRASSELISGLCP